MEKMIDRKENLGCDFQKEQERWGKTQRERCGERKHENGREGGGNVASGGSFF